ncbi:alpha/beta fold hydrolase [Pseudonocardia humida]|uniref:Alpha/beta hydrolase n=1 Tax=Pseudonocardia humida TaxID=2800819 RepID=A0ABT1A4M2_9PSEU|nr:alpha/beta hydrolase [Pseudonocardia humida]MCO1657724.1 alpha/beta hydrolase [Pseudonocardia humida]
MAVGGFTSTAARERFVAAYDEAMAELPAPAATDDVETSFGTVRTYRFGPAEVGPPLVLLPGTASSTPVWADNLPSLLRIGLPVVTVDLLGEPGLSEQTRAITGPADQARWLGETLDGLGLSGVHLLGLSFGGWSAANLAMHRPDLLASLTLLDPAGTVGRIGVKAVLFSLVATLPLPKRVQQANLSWIAGGARAEEHAVGRMIEAGMRGYRRAQPFPTYPTDAQLRAITAPALVVIAGRSIIHHPGRAAARAGLIPNATVELWPDASHALNGEFPDRVADRVAALVAAA